MSAYYNEHDPFAAAWLRELIKEGQIAPGVVDERSIEDVVPADLAAYTQCHFFAGIGGWSLALRLAGWPDDRPIWTGSCPCQPFSAAGKGAGFADERHLWPSFYWLIDQCQPAVVMGEQVESAIRHGWLDLVLTDLENSGYAAGAVGLPAASVEAPHGRHRLWWVAESGQQSAGRGLHRSVEGPSTDRGGTPDQFGGSGGAGIMALPDGGIPGDGGLQRGGEHLQRAEDTVTGEWLAHPRRAVDERRGGPPEAPGAEGSATGEAPQWERGGVTAGAGVSSGSMEDPERTPRARLGQHGGPGLCEQETAGPPRSGGAPSWWGNAEWIPCRDQKYRPVEPGTFPLAHGVPARVGRLRGYGNAIVPQVAAEVIRAYLASCDTPLGEEPACQTPS